jgi:hypothetical protein
MAYVTSLRALRVATRNGFVLVDPNRVTWIRDEALPFALAAGCSECDEKGTPRHPPAPPTRSEPVTIAQASEREKTILAAIKYLVTKGDVKDFRKDNVPKLTSVERLIDFAPSASEVHEAFIKFQEQG